MQKHNHTNKLDYVNQSITLLIDNVYDKINNKRHNASKDVNIKNNRLFIKQREIEEIQNEYNCLK